MADLDRCPRCGTDQTRCRFCARAECPWFKPAPGLIIDDLCAAERACAEERPGRLRERLAALLARCEAAEADAARLRERVAGREAKVAEAARKS